MANKSWYYIQDKPDPDSGLVLHYRLNDENTGEIIEPIRDESSFGNHGVIKGNPIWAVGYSGGGAVDLDGTGDYIEVERDASLEIARNLTVIARIRPESGLGAITQIAAKSKKAWRFGLDANDKVVFRAQIDGTLTETCIGTTTVLVNTWYWVGATYSIDTGNAIVYLDGDKETTTAYGTEGIDLFPEKLVIGRSDENTDAELFGGRLGVLKIFNRTLTDAEIKSDFNNSQDRYTGKQIVIVETPDDSNKAIDVWYHKLAKRLINDLDIPQINALYHNDLIDYVIWQILEAKRKESPEGLDDQEKSLMNHSRLSYVSNMNNAKTTMRRQLRPRAPQVSPYGLTYKL